MHKVETMSFLSTVVKVKKYVFMALETDPIIDR